MHLCYPWEERGERKVPLVDGQTVPGAGLKAQEQDWGHSKDRDTGLGTLPSVLQTQAQGTGLSHVRCREGFGRQSEESAHGHDNPIFLLK